MIMTFRYAVLILVALTSLMPNAGGAAVSNQSSLSSSFQVCQSSGPSFKLTPWVFMDLVPSTEPVTLTLELRVGVTDPDGVSNVIGSYKNNSSSNWNNVSMSRDAFTSDPDDFVAWPLNFTIIGANSLVIWDIMFYANDSLNNWNTSSLHRISFCRQGSTNTTADIPLQISIIITVTIVAVILPVLYIIYRRRA